MAGGCGVVGSKGKRRGAPRADLLMVKTVREVQGLGDVLRCQRERDVCGGLWGRRRLRRGK